MKYYLIIKNNELHVDQYTGKNLILFSEDSRKVCKMFPLEKHNITKKLHVLSIQLNL